MTMPKAIADKLAGYHQHKNKAAKRLSEANYLVKKALIESGLELNAMDRKYIWDILGEKCHKSPAGIHIYQVFSFRANTCIFCKKVSEIPGYEADIPHGGLVLSREEESHD